MDKFSALIATMASQVYTYLQRHQVVDIKYGQLFVCWSYVNKALFLSRFGGTAQTPPEEYKSVLLLWALRSPVWLLFEILQAQFAIFLPLPHKLCTLGGHGWLFGTSHR